MLHEYCTHFNEDYRTMKKHSRHRDNRMHTTDPSDSVKEPYMVPRQERSDKIDPLVEAHGRKWWLSVGDTINAGSQKNSKDRIRGDDKKGESVQKKYLSKSTSAHYQDWVKDFMREHPNSHHLIASERRWAEWRPFWVRPVTARRIQGCVCTHCEGARLLENTIKAGRAAGDLHASKQPRKAGCIDCPFNVTCPCECFLCNMSKEKSKEPYFELAVCDYDGYYPKLQCAFGQCEDCGLERVLHCPLESRRSRSMWKGKKHMKVTMVIPGKKAKDMVKPRTVEQQWQHWINDCQLNFSFVITHQYMANRIQHQYQKLLREELQVGEELIVADFLEAFKCFEDINLYMDHYSHEQVTIFLIMVFRHRTEKEKLLSGTATFSLPEHLTCELHAFFSEDKTKDAGFAQLCLTKYLDDAKVRKNAINRIIIATDGGRQHFKLFQNMNFMSEESIKRNMSLWWLFFQSYHGMIHVKLVETAMYQNYLLMNTLSGHC